jgi:hypothetical protein
LNAVELARQQEIQKLMPSDSPDEVQQRKKKMDALLQQAQIERQQAELNRNN